MNDESKIFGISVRAFLVTILVFTVCFMSLAAMKIAEPLYSAFMLALGFYFGQKTGTTASQSSSNGTTQING